MNKIIFPSAAGTSAGSTAPSTEEGTTYIMIDGSRGMSGALIPNATNTLSLGTLQLPFSSGVFTTCVCVGQYQLRTHDENIYELQVHDASGADIPSRASFWYTSHSGVALTGARAQLPSSGQIAWSSNAVDPRIDYDTNLSRKYAGLVQVGTTTANASGVIHGASGVFRTNVVLTAPNGSGWKITVANDGTLAVTGPIIVG